MSFCLKTSVSRPFVLMFFCLKNSVSALSVLLFFCQNKGFAFIINIVYLCNNSGSGIKATRWKGHIESVFVLSCCIKSPNFNLKDKTVITPSLAYIYPMRERYNGTAWDGLFISGGAFGDAFTTINQTSLHAFVCTNLKNQATIRETY